jgi:hypothetical protein
VAHDFNNLLDEPATFFAASPYGLLRHLGKLPVNVVHSSLELLLPCSYTLCSLLKEVFVFFVIQVPVASGADHAQAPKFNFRDARPCYSIRSVAS